MSITECTALSLIPAYNLEIIINRSTASEIKLSEKPFLLIGKYSNIGDIVL
jgi:hypothetical protein